jgi:hypothetical protein
MYKVIMIVMLVFSVVWVIGAFSEAIRLFNDTYEVKRKDKSSENDILK